MKDDSENMTDEEREEYVKHMLDNTALQGLVQAPEYNNPAMIYGPPNMPNQNLGMMMFMKRIKWIDDERWICNCDTVNTGKFCSECGTAAPAKPARWISDDKWECVCGTENSGKFCTECGSKAPDKTDGSDKKKWTCECGTENTGRYCTECGKIKPVDESDTWKCPSCGAPNLGKYCKECGTPRPRIN